MRIFCLSLGSILAILFLIQLKAGAKYDSYLEALESADYPLKSLYGVGFAWSNLEPFGLRGKIKETLLSQAKLLYSQQYAEYHANIVWAQTITIVHLALCIGLLLGGALNFSFFCFVGAITAIFFAIYFLNRMKGILEERQTNCLVELPEIVSSMALLINSGMRLRETWEMIAYSKEGDMYELMCNACEDMKNGVSDTDAIYKFGMLSNTPEIKKFSSALIQGLEKGSRDLSDFLAVQSSEMWNLKKQIMLQKGESAASKLVIPTAMIFVGILIIIIAAAFKMAT